MDKKRKLPVGADPRPSIIADRLAPVKRILLVGSGKGGVGKTLVASTLALAAADLGLKAGIFDADFYNPSVHVVLGLSGAKPAEDRGVVPPVAAGVKVMTPAFYAGDGAMPLRGPEVTDAMIELLTITRWGELDLLLVDLPPGTGDEVLEATRLMERAEALLVTTPSRLALNGAVRLASLLRALGTKVIGAVENMAGLGGLDVRERLSGSGIRYLGSLPLDPAVERCMGDPRALLETSFADGVRLLLRQLVP